MTRSSGANIGVEGDEGATVKSTYPPFVCGRGTASRSGGTIGPLHGPVLFLSPFVDEGPHPRQSKGCRPRRLAISGLCSLYPSIGNGARFPRPFPPGRGIGSESLFIFWAKLPPTQARVPSRASLASVEFLDDDMDREVGHSFGHRSRCTRCDIARLFKVMHTLPYAPLTTMTPRAASVTPA